MRTIKPFAIKNYELNTAKLKIFSDILKKYIAKDVLVSGYFDLIYTKTLPNTIEENIIHNIYYELNTINNSEDNSIINRTLLTKILNQAINVTQKYYFNKYINSENAYKEENKRYSDLVFNTAELDIQLNKFKIKNASEKYYNNKNDTIKIIQDNITLSNLFTDNYIYIAKNTKNDFASAQLFYSGSQVFSNRIKDKYSILYKDINKSFNSASRLYKSVENEIKKRLNIYKSDSIYFEWLNNINNRLINSGAYNISNSYNAYNSDKINILLQNISQNIHDIYASETKYNLDDFYKENNNFIQINKNRFSINDKYSIRFKNAQIKAYRKYQRFIESLIINSEAILNNAELSQNSADYNNIKAFTARFSEIGKRIKERLLKGASQNKESAIYDGYKDTISFIDDNYSSYNIIKKFIGQTNLEKINSNLLNLLSAEVFNDYININADNSIDYSQALLSHDEFIQYIRQRINKLNYKENHKNLFKNSNSYADLLNKFDIRSENKYDNTYIINRKQAELASERIDSFIKLIYNVNKTDNGLSNYNSNNKYFSGNFDSDSYNIEQIVYDLRKIKYKLNSYEVALNNKSIRKYIDEARDIISASSSISNDYKFTNKSDMLSLSEYSGNNTAYNIRNSSLEKNNYSIITKADKNSLLNSTNYLYLFNSKNLYHINKHNTEFDNNNFDSYNNIHSNNRFKYSSILNNINKYYDSRYHNNLDINNLFNGSLLKNSLVNYNYFNSDIAINKSVYRSLFGIKDIKLDYTVKAYNEFEKKNILGIKGKSLINHSYEIKDNTDSNIYRNSYDITLNPYIVSSVLMKNGLNDYRLISKTANKYQRIVKGFKSPETINKALGSIKADRVIEKITSIVSNKFSSEIAVNPIENVNNRYELTNMTYHNQNNVFTHNISTSDDSYSNSYNIDMVYKREGEEYNRNIEKVNNNQLNIENNVNKKIEELRTMINNNQVNIKKISESVYSNIKKDFRLERQRKGLI